MVYHATTCFRHSKSWNEKKNTIKTYICSPRYFVFFSYYTNAKREYHDHAQADFDFRQVHVIWWLSYCQVEEKISVEPWIDHRIGEFLFSEERKRQWCDRPSKWKRHFDEIFVSGYTWSCHNDNFQCSQWRKFHQNDISVSVDYSRVRPFPWWGFPVLALSVKMCEFIIKSCLLYTLITQ